MSQVHRFMVVPDANVAVAREVCAKIAGPAGSNMWLVGLSATGVAPATYWISSGMVDEQFVPLLGNAALTFAVYQAAGGTTHTLADIQALYVALTFKQVSDPGFDVSHNMIAYSVREDAQGSELAAIAALGLQPVH